MKILNYKDLKNKYKVRNDTMNKSHLQKINNCPIYTRDSNFYSERGFVNIDNGNVGGSQWTSFIVRDNKSISYDSFGGQPDKFLLEQLPKPIIYHN